MSDRKEKYISGILILLTLEIIFFPVLKISTWDVSLLKMLNMIYGKSNNIFAGSIQTALKQYMSSYIYMLLFLIILTIAVGVSAWVIRSSSVYCRTGSYRYYCSYVVSNDQRKNGYDREYSKLFWNWKCCAI